MKILYAVQATGNGHISRALELLPLLGKYGKTDIFLSGSNSQLGKGLPVLFRSSGLSLFYNSKGGLDYLKTFKNLKPIGLFRNAVELPVKDYDMVINDFEFVTSLACKIKNKPSVHFGHQASFVSDLTPRPFRRSNLGEFILRNYCHATMSAGLHFKRYDQHIHLPVLRSGVLHAPKINRGHVTVYLPQFGQAEILKYFKSLSFINFQIFSPQTKTISRQENITWFPVDSEMFLTSMIESHGVITGAGFETPAETLYLNKRLMVFPIQGQYEQQCNAAALSELGVTVLESMNANTGAAIHHWYNASETAFNMNHPGNAQIVDWLFKLVADNRFREQSGQAFSLR